MLTRWLKKRRMQGWRISKPLEWSICLLMLAAMGVIAVYFILSVNRDLMSYDLADAARAGDIAKVKKLLADDIDPNKANVMGYAKRGGHKKVIRLLEWVGAKEQQSVWKP